MAIPVVFAGRFGAEVCIGTVGEAERTPWPAGAVGCLRPVVVSDALASGGLAAIKKPRSTAGLVGSGAGDQYLIEQP